MTDPQAVAELLVFDALVDGVTLAPVFQDVPEGTPAPVVVVAELSGDPIGGKGARSMKLDLTIVTEVWQEVRQPILDLQAEVRGVLDGKTLRAPGWEVTALFVTSEARQVGPGQYAGTSTFTVFVTPA